MAEYKDIKGFKVQTVSTDPVASGIAGATWSSIASLNTARAFVSSGGTTTAGIVAGGYDGEGYPSGYTGLTETWNGSAWTETADMNSGRQTHGFGTSTALIAGAGNRGVSSPPTAPGYQNLVEFWNGTAWTEVAEYNNNKASRGTAGQSGTAGIVFGGITPDGGDGYYTESWNGSSWTELGDLNASRYNLATNAGTQTSALGVGGQFPSPPQDGTLVESWNGSSWTEIAELNTARNNMGGSGTGNTSLLVFGGNPGKKANTESWDGSSWTERNDLSTAREGNGGFGTSTTSAIYAGGQDATTYTAVSEEFSVAGATDSLQNLGQVFYNSTSDAFKVTQQPVSGGTWASGGSLNTARTYSGASGLGTQTDSLLFGGRKNSAPASNKAETEKYDGTSWTEVNDLPAAKEGVAGFGTTTNAVSAGGGDSPAVSNPTCTWDGTNWTEVNEINTARNKPKGAGTYTAGLIFSGQPYPSVSAATEEWDGTNWTSGGSLNTARTGVGNAGASQTAALAFGGGPPTSIGNTEEYNGTSWSEKADLNTTRNELGGLGTSTLALAIGGEAAPGRVANTEFFNGTVWTEVNDLATARNNGSGSGTGTLGLYAGGNNPNESAATEEWTAPTVNSTLTAS
jgi:hypothetical protein